MIKEALSIRRIGESLANAVHMKTSPICVYGSDRAPENAIRSSRINSCLAQSMYEIAEGRIDSPSMLEAKPPRAFAAVLEGQPGLGMLIRSPIAGHEPSNQESI